MTQTVSHIFIGMQNLAAWVVIVVAVSTILGAIWTLVDTFLTYGIGAKVVTPPPAPLQHPHVTSFKGSGAKGFARQHQQLSANIIAFRRVH